jgi:cytochrome c oxidase assembly protein subunit 11
MPDEKNAPESGESAASRRRADDARAMRRTVAPLVLLVMGMTGLAFAAVPLYDLFCRVTGYGGTTQIAQADSTEVLDREITIRFDSNTSPKLDWRFKPVQTRMKVKIGESRLAVYEAKNTSAAPLSGTATYNVTPEAAGSYFAKVQCFCFTEQRLEAGQRVDMPVSFFVDPAIMDDPDARDITEITLSYTFFPMKGETQTGAAETRAGQKLAAAQADR